MAVEGNVAFFSKYPNGCKEVISMCVSSNVLYLSHKGEPGGVVAIKMSDLTVEMVAKNGSAHRVESSHVAAYRNGIVYADTEGRQIKAKIPGEEVTVIAGSGMEGNCNGRTKDASFSQPMGICVELDRNCNIFVTDAQTGSVKLITTIKGTAEFLKHLGMLYKAFSVHQKHQVVVKISLADAIELLKVLDSYLKRSTDEVISTFDKLCKPMGAKGTISSQTQSSVSMILKGLQDLAELLKELNTSYEVDLHTCLTVQVENLHAMGHFKDQFPTCLQYALSIKASNELYGGLLTTLPTRSRTTL